MTSIRIIYREDYFTTCTIIGCGLDATGHPLYCDNHRTYMLSCGCPIEHPGGCWFAFYNHFEYAKALRLAREANLPPLLKDRDGNPVPRRMNYKLCSECHSCRFSLLGTSNQLVGWPD